jgi:hypothetical protein
MNLRQAAEMALEALEKMSPDTDTLVEVFRSMLMALKIQGRLQSKKHYAKHSTCKPLSRRAQRRGQMFPMQVSG